MKVRVEWVVLWLGLTTLLCGSTLAQERWVYRHNGPGDGSDGARSVVSGSGGDIWAAGYSRDTSTDFTVISLTSAGDTNWVYTYNGPVDATDDAYSIAYGSDGNLYVAGGSYLTVGRATDFTVISLTSSGVEQWVYQYDGGAGALDRAYSIACGADGNIYAAGNCWVGGGDYWDFTIISLPPTGPPSNWIYEYDGPGSEMDNSDAAYSVVYGLDDNIYAAGKSYGSGTWRDFTVVSVTASGTERWVYRYNGSMNLDDVAQSIIYGGDGSIYVTGYVRNGNRDVIVVSLPSSGPPANWVYTYNGSGDGDDGGSSIAYGSDGNIYVAGYSTGAGAHNDFTVISLTTTGSERWVYTYNGPADSADRASAVVFGADYNVYAAGGSTDTLTGYDFTVVGLDTAGAELWVYTYNGPGDAEDGANSVVIGGDGNIYAAGYSSGSGTDEDFTVISLRADVGIQERPINDQLTMTNDQLLHNYPNPFGAGGTVISFNVERSTCNVSLKVYDLAGRPIRTLVDNEPMTPSSPDGPSGPRGNDQIPMNVVWDGRDDEGNRIPSGVYFCRLIAGDCAGTKKLVLLR